MKLKSILFLEWSGVITAILYSLFVAVNIGIEFYGFCLLIVSAILIGMWAYFQQHKGILLLQIFYAIVGIIGFVRGDIYFFCLANDYCFNPGPI